MDKLEVVKPDVKQLEIIQEILSQNRFILETIMNPQIMVDIPRPKLSSDELRALYRKWTKDSDG